MLVLRPIASDDLDALVTLASQLDSVNLPSDRNFLERRIQQSIETFQQPGQHAESAAYVFVLEDQTLGKCIGTCMILAKQGTPEKPYYWLEVSSEERVSEILDRRFVHTKLRLRSTSDGPTEIGGLILDPSYRNHPEKCGKALSIVRFAYISAHPEYFQQQIIAEMLSPFESPGVNRLWDAFGSQFTGLSYREADRLSARDKGFIADLFPEDPVYVTLFPESVQEVIGEANESSKAAVRILERVGFHPLNQVDPFDGGPYYGAARDAIQSVRERRELVLPSVTPERDKNTHGPLALLSAEGRLGFRACVVPMDHRGVPIVTKACQESLGVEQGEHVAVTPLP